MSRLVAIFAFVGLCALPGWAAAQCKGADLADRWGAAFDARLDARVADVPFAEGTLWEVSRDGATSTIFGTLHLPDDDVATPPTILLDRMEAAEELLVEVTRLEEQRMTRKILLNPSLFLSKNGAELQDALTSQEWSELERAIAPYGLPVDYANRIAPWYLAVTLSIPACVTGYAAEGKAILDRRIEAAALAQDIPVAGLEIPEDVFELFSDLSYDDQVQMLRASLPTAGLAEDMLATTKQMYLDGQIARIEAVAVEMLEETGQASAMSAAEQFLELLLTERNARWMNILLPKLIEGDRVVAVGALHLVGEHGLLSKLEAEGFTVTRLPL
ncbi:MAG: TraB/GumN family protein [Pseudomonadota bacterium]